VRARGVSYDSAHSRTPRGHFSEYNRLLISTLLRYHSDSGAAVLTAVAPTRVNARPAVVCEGFALALGRSEPHQSLARMTSRAAGCDGRTYNLTARVGARSRPLSISPEPVRHYF
jgi:hypothetical protein